MNARAFDQFIGRWRAVSATLPDRRTGDKSCYAMADIALSAFSVFFTQCPSFLSFQQNMEQSRGRNNARSLFQVECIPSDNHIRHTLDPIAPSQRFSLFDDLHQACEQAGLLAAMRAVENTRLIALDATWYFSSQSKNIHCPAVPASTTPMARSLIFTVRSPRSSSVRVTNRSWRCARSSSRRRTGRSKQDCELNAAKRWLAAHAGRYATGMTPCWAMVSTPINPSAARCCCTGLISSSPASPRPIRT